ncbi:hypothetical protein H0H93_010299 [Arthromyces matolae]|nr:hypothetical protein H0H93_010299 [Arthromyces matolae]
MIHMNINVFLIFHIFFTASIALPQPPLPAVPAIKGSAHYKTEWTRAEYPQASEYNIMTNPSPEIWTGGPPFKFHPNQLAQEATLIQEAVKICNEGQCQYYGEGKEGITWLVTLSDGGQHILKVMFPAGTRNPFRRESASISHNEFAKVVYMNNRVMQLEAFGVLLDSDLPHTVKGFYILMPHMGIPFRRAFNKYPRKFIDKKNVFIWNEDQKIVAEYALSYGVEQK